ncbi:MAG: nucleoside hydrolase [Alphaproteobacteria bacterium]|nr:nucleoside hydrolase [Alphaproteobacteria bacterium]
MTRPIIIDTDPGQDDAVAVCLALAAPDALTVLGITTVAGNVPLALTTINALKTVELCGRTDVPIHAGAAGPLVGEAVTAEHVHGRTGLDGYDLPTPAIAAASSDAVGFLRETLEAHPPGAVTLCCLGPLTNLALLLKRHPDAAARLHSVVLMGGAYFEVGNITPAAEFNIYADPEAAAKVFASGLELTVMPLDVTHQLLLTEARKSALAAIGNRVSDVIDGWVNFFERFDLDKYGADGAPLHDPSVIAYLLQPELFSGRHINVEIECESPLTRGMSVMDWWRVTDRKPNAQVMGSVDADGFYALLCERLGHFGGGR